VSWVSQNSASSSMDAKSGLRFFVFASVAISFSLMTAVLHAWHPVR
jgi:hypothetical protein